MVTHKDLRPVAAGLDRTEDLVNKVEEEDAAVVVVGLFRNLKVRVGTIRGIPRRILTTTVTV